MLYDCTFMEKKKKKSIKMQMLLSLDKDDSSNAEKIWKK